MFFLFALLIVAASGMAPGMVAAQVAAVFPIVEDSRWGLINGGGEVIVEPTYEAMGLLTGRFRPDFVFAHILQPIRVKKDGKWGFIDNDGKVLIAPTYEEARPFSEGLAAVRIGGEWGFVDREGDVVIPARFTGAMWFSEARAAVRVGERWGFIAPDGEMVIEPRYFRAGIFYDGMALVAADPSVYGETTFIDAAGNVLVDPTDHPAKNIDAKPVAIDIGGRKAFLDPRGSLLVEPREGTPPEPAEGLPVVDTGGSYTLITADASGRLHLSQTVRHFFTDGLGLVQRSQGFGYINSTGELVIPAKYADARPFSEGLAAVAAPDGRWGFINTDGEFVIEPRLVWTSSFSEGLAAARSPRGRMGFINKEGTFVIEPEFDDASDFSYGLARVDGRDEWAYINRKGELVWGPVTGFRPF
jgi:hypothetical protein